jgi:hypothetical protein
MDTQDQLQPVVTALLNNLKGSLEKEISKTISAEVINRVISAELTPIISNIVQYQIEHRLAKIPHSQIDFAGLSIAGDHIKGGIIENFGSTGIEDRASSVQLTLMNDAAAFEGAVHAPSLRVRGAVTIDGDLIVRGDVPTDSPMFENLVAYSSQRVQENLNQELFQGFSNTIYNNISEKGLELDRITQGGRDVIRGNQLGYHIVDSNLQRLGQVRDLQTVGEALLSNTLYVTERRVGVNTLDPSAAFVVWDEECEIVLSKRKQDTAYVGTQRHQKLVVGSNSKENIVLDTDGAVQISALTVGKTQMTSADAVPNYEGSRGQIVWNEIPDSGGAIGWVCLGGTRWAGFGTIE